MRGINFRGTELHCGGEEQTPGRTKLALLPYLHIDLSTAPHTYTPHMPKELQEFRYPHLFALCGSPSALCLTFTWLPPFHL